MYVTIVYNNVVADPALSGAWGMACVVQGASQTILFDTGGDGPTLLSNMEAMGMGEDEIDAIVLSHNHGDHTGGLWDVLARNASVTVYVPASFPSGVCKRIEGTGANVERVREPAQIAPGIFTTGEVGNGIGEQALVITSGRGLFVITGCSHPGVDRMAERAAKAFDTGIYAVTGGFHLGGASTGEITEIIEALKRLGVQRIGPSHCTGERAMELFEEAWGDGFFDAGCGARIEIPVE